MLLLMGNAVSSRMVVLIMVVSDLRRHMLLQDRGRNLGRICGVPAGVIVSAIGRKKQC